jgi:hypothetical protein
MLHLVENTLLLIFFRMYLRSSLPNLVSETLCARVRIQLRRSGASEAWPRIRRKTAIFSFLSLSQQSFQSYHHDKASDLPLDKLSPSQG